jgi:hypothetical protein
MPTAPMPTEPAPSPDNPVPTIPGGCLTPDPFVALGGGRCVNGGWLPPGFDAPTTTIPVAPQPTPTPVSGGCITPDPFVALGRGRCINGGWLPPSGPAPTAPTPTAPAPSPTPTPVPPSATTGGCRTPDPFAVFGGGKCVNGGWLPPGMDFGSVSTQPAPAPAPLPSPVATDQPAPTVYGGCVTPDPFITIPGLKGVCINGGWIPVRR